MLLLFFPQQQAAQQLQTFISLLTQPDYPDLLFLLRPWWSKPLTAPLPRQWVVQAKVCDPVPVNMRGNLLGTDWGWVPVGKTKTIVLKRNTGAEGPTLPDILYLMRLMATVSTEPQKDLAKDKKRDKGFKSTDRQELSSRRPHGGTQLPQINHIVESS